MGWLGTTLFLTALLDEIKSTGRISELAGVTEKYSYMAKVSFAEVNVHDGLESTLTILVHKLKQGVNVERGYSRNLPRIFDHSDELYQV